ncbi:MAG: CPBP family intramembrane glutamic endopeptidase [Planctomycetota bacterium]
MLLTATASLVFLHYQANGPTFESRPIPIEKLARWSLLCFGAYFLIPAVLTRFVLGIRLSEFGLSVRGIARHLPLYAALYLGVLPLVWFASRQPEFLNTYPFADSARDGLSELLIWELLYGLQFFSLEFFFRGFMVFGLEKRFGVSAVIVMTVPYCMIHFQKPMPEATGAIFAGLILGVVALRTRSIFGGVIIHWAVAITMDVLAIMQTGGFRGN